MNKLRIFFVGFCLLLLTASGQTGAQTGQLTKKAKKLIVKWEPGSSSGIFTDYSQKDFDELKNNGIKYIELGLSFRNKKTQLESEAWIRDFRQKADKAGLKVWSIHLPFSRVLDISAENAKDRENMVAECKSIMALCAPLKPEKYVIHPSSEPIADEEREQRMENCIASMKILTDEVKKYNAQLVVEDLPRTCLGNTSAEILRIVQATGNGLGVCFDTNHLLKEKPEEFAEKVGGLIKTLHVSDYDGIDERHWLPGTGIINWNNVISALAESGYKGPFMYETSMRKPLSESSKERIRLTPKDLSENFKELKAGLVR